jgi:hypothetical protein
MGSLVDILKSVAESTPESVTDNETNEVNELTHESPPWRRLYSSRASWWRSAGYSGAQAQRLAWSAVATDWYRSHGKRVPDGLCAGCGEPLSGAGVSLLPYGERAHADDEHKCIIAYGRRWKRAAAAALASHSISLPSRSQPS